MGRIKFLRFVQIAEFLWIMCNSLSTRWSNTTFCKLSGMEKTILIINQ